jgi:hypothetical protein
MMDAFGGIDAVRPGLMDQRDQPARGADIDVPERSDQLPGAGTREGRLKAEQVVAGPGMDAKPDLSASLFDSPIGSAIIVPFDPP